MVGWLPTLDLQAAEMGIPSLIRTLAIRLLGSRLGRVLGQREAIDFQRLDFVTRADELSVPILLLHSEDDGFVPPIASIALAEARPDLVTMHRWTGARHTKLWNHDQALFDRQIGDWLIELDASLSSR